jgi:hypothetical protein
VLIAQPLVNGRHPHPGLQLGGDVLVVLADRRPGHLQQPGVSQIRIKVSGCMRSMTGARTFCAIRSYLATAARHGIGALDALTSAAEGHLWIPQSA